MSTPAYYEFGEMRINVGRMQLERAGRVVPIEPKVFDLLRMLVENRHRVVTKEELLESIWTGTFVTQNALTRAIAQLRKSLGDDAHESRFIETAARRGYRFIAPVRVIESTPDTADTAAGPEDSRVATAAFNPAPEAAVGNAGQSSPSVNFSTSPAKTPRFRTMAAVALTAFAALAIVASLWALRASRDTTDAEPPPHLGPLVRVTNRLGFNGQPSVSPDGSRVAYVSDESGSLEIRITGFAPGARDLPLTTDSGQNVQPAWSPDGQWLAFHSRKKRGIWIVPSTGGPPSQVADFGSEPGWSPDSRHIVFTSYAGGMATQAQLWTVARDGSNLRPVTKPGAPAGGPRNPAWSHNGKWIVFSVYAGAWNESVVAVDVATGVTTRVLDGLGSYPTIAPSDDTIYYVTDFRDRALRLMKVAVDPSTGRAIGAPEHVRDLPLPAKGLSLAPDGALVIALIESDVNLWAIDLDDENVSEPLRLTHASVRSARPVYSRSGRIAFAQSDGGAATTWVIDGDGKNLEPAIVDRNNASPEWSPDGGRLFVRYYPEGGEQRFAWADLATRRITPGMPSTGLESFSVAPDGRSISYHKAGKDGIINVWIQPLDGGSARQLTFDRESASYASWSPDGRNLAVEITRGETTQVGIIAASGGPVRMLTNSAGQNWPHSWSPDGKWIAVAGERDGVWNLYAVSTETGALRQLTRLTSAEGYVRYPAWSPDGKRIVFERGIHDAGIWRFEPRKGS